MASSASLLRSDRANPHLRRLLFSHCFCRGMGGGPRTFPGGLNKWQYKRMHEKMARDKERRLLQTEKQLYLARLRSEIRAKLSPSPNRRDDPAYASGSAPMSSVEHVKALADRFMKTGAEDLWNESDGPIHSPKVRSIREAPQIDDHHSKDQINRSKSAIGSFNQHRQYSVVAHRSPFSTPKYNQRHNSSSDDEDERSNFRLPRFEMRDVVSEEEDGGVREGRVSRRKMFSRAALRDYDRKMTRRSPKPIEEEGDRESLDQFREIREELRRKATLRNDVEKHIEEESILTPQRFHDSNISPSTIKALQSAGYSQMTVVQEAALPTCLEGKDALVKARTGTGKSAAFLCSKR